MAEIKTNVARRKFDVVIVGAGGSGMRASLQLARAGLNVAVLSNDTGDFVPASVRVVASVNGSAVLLAWRPADVALMIKSKLPRSFRSSQ